MRDSNLIWNRRDRARRPLLQKSEISPEISARHLGAVMLVQHPGHHWFKKKKKLYILFVYVFSALNAESSLNLVCC